MTTSKHDPEKLAKANEWLDKAVRLEADGKSAKMVDLAFEKAVTLEKEAFAN